MGKGRYVEEYDYEGRRAEALEFISDIVEEIITRRCGSDHISGRLIDTEDDKPLVHVDVSIDIY